MNLQHAFKGSKGYCIKNGFTYYFKYLNINQPQRIIQINTNLRLKIPPMPHRFSTLDLSIYSFH